MPDARDFVRDFFTSMTEQVLTDDDPAAVVDRFYTPDIVEISDGITMSRTALVAHMGPIRKSLRNYRFEVHEAVRDGHQLAARLTIHGELRKHGWVITDVYMFADLAHDERIRRIDQVTRRRPAGDRAD